MKTVNVARAKAVLSALIESALDGERVVIARRGVPLVSLEPIAGPGGERRLGGLRGQIRMSDGFDETPDDFADYS